MDIQEELKQALMIDEELGSIYDNMVAPPNTPDPTDLPMIHIDGIVYEILHGYHGYDSMYDSVYAIFTKWAEENGGEYFDYKNASVLVAIPS